MTMRSKTALLASIVLAMLVIAGIIADFQMKRNELNNGLNVVRGAVIALGIVSVPIVYFTKIRKGKYEVVLNEEYYAQYEIIKDAVMSSQLAAGTKKEIKEDILELFISAQEEGKPINEVVENSEEFVKEILAAYGKKKWGILDILDGLIYIDFFLLGAQLLTWFEQPDQDFFETKLGLNMVIFFIITAFVMVPVIKRVTAKKNALAFILPLAYGVGFVIFMEGMWRYLSDITMVERFLTGTVKVISNSIILFLSVLIIPAALATKSGLRKKQLS